MSLNWEKCNKQNRMWKQGVEVVSRSRPSRRKKRATKVGDALLDLEHLKGKRRSKIAKELLRNKSRRREKEKA